MAAHVSLIWFRYDLRVADNPALEKLGLRLFSGIVAMTRRVGNAI